MRLLIVGIAALAAFAIATPSFAQDETMPSSTPTPTTKPGSTKSKSAASCQKLKSSSERASCLKKVSVAKATPSKKTKKPATIATPKQPDAAQLAPVAPAPVATPSGGPVAVPPLPSKTI